MTSYYAGLSLREIYEKKCSELHCRKNSGVCQSLPDIPDDFHSLTFIDLSRNFIGPKGLLPLLEIIRCSRNVRTLDLRKQELDNDAIDSLCLALRQHPSVIRIDLSDNPLTMGSGTSLLQLAKANPVIEHIIVEKTNLRTSIRVLLQTQLENNRVRKHVTAEREVMAMYFDKPLPEKTENKPIVIGTTTAGNTTNVTSPKISGNATTVVPSSSDVKGPSRERLHNRDVELALFFFSHNVHEVIFDENPIPLLGQLCDEQHAWFYDVRFAADDEAIQHRATTKYGISCWRRIGDIYPSATLFPQEGEQCRVVLPRQCPLAFSWILTCLETVSGDLESLRNIVLCSSSPEHGIYGIRVHIDGGWRYVLVDDFLPVNSKDELIFANPVDGKYFWPCILEKALAKMHGGYTAIDLTAIIKSQIPGSTNHPQDRERVSQQAFMRTFPTGTPEAPFNAVGRTNCAKTLSDLSGGVGVVRFLHSGGFQSDEWWQTFLDFHNAGAMIVALSEIAAKTLSGIEPCHVYRVVQVRQMNGVRLIELSSQWATIQWKGDWSDDSVQWSRHRDLDVTLRGNRSTNKTTCFWMSYVDFIMAFSQVHLCQVFDGFNERVVAGEWGRRSAGGSCSGQKWHINPHYSLKINRESIFFINLAVPDVRFAPTDVESLAIHIVSSEHYPLHHKGERSELVASTSYVATDSISFQGILKEGDDYWIIPSSHTGGVMGKFFLRIFCLSGFAVSYECIARHWSTSTYSETVECSGEYRIGEDNAQIALSFHSNIPKHGSMGSILQSRLNSADNAKVLPPLVMRVSIPENNDLALGLFLVESTMIDGRPSRTVGVIHEESIIASSPFVINDCVYLESEVAPSETYTLLTCVNPPGARVQLDFTIWSARPLARLTPLPVWGKKTVQASWPQGSGSYYEVIRNPQIELYPIKPHSTLVVRMHLTEANYADPAIVFFVLANDGRQGEGIKGQIPADRVVVRSQYVRHHSVQCELQVADPLDSLLVIPCLQPVGSIGSCTITVSTESGDVMIRVLS